MKQRAVQIASFNSEKKWVCQWREKKKEKTGKTERGERKKYRKKTEPSVFKGELNERGGSSEGITGEKRSPVFTGETRE